MVPQDVKALLLASQNPLIVAGTGIGPAAGTVCGASAEDRRGAEANGQGGIPKSKRVREYLTLRREHSGALFFFRSLKSIMRDNY